jgi:membrane dipeptidase
MSASFFDSGTTQERDVMAERANTMTPIFDGHNDTLLNLIDTGRDYYERSEIGHIDDVRAKEGGLVGGFFACFVPDPKGRHAPAQEQLDRMFGSGLKGVDLENEWGGPSLAYAQQFTNAMVALLLNLEAGGGAMLTGQDDKEQPSFTSDPLTIIHFAEDLVENVEEGRFSAIMHFESAEAIDENFYALVTYHSAGLRSLGPVWSRTNQFAHGVPFQFPSSPDTGPGLTDLGRELVVACNMLGIMLDVSHMNEKGFWDLAEITQAPIVATHSNAHALCPSARNLTDKQLDAIAESGGMVGVNFNVPFLHPEGARDPEMPLSVMADHVDYLVDKLGIDGVGFGSDFDGAMMPDALSDASKLPDLVATLRERGYDDASLRKLGYENWARVLGVTWGL